MNLKTLLLVMTTLCLTFVLYACQGAEEKTPDAIGTNTAPPVQSVQPDTDAEGTVDFGLQEAPDPNFDSPSSGGSGDKIYTIQGDYAYEMDPNTLQTIGPPLDPITHEPVDNPVLTGPNPSTPNNPQNSTPPAVSTPPVEQPPATITPDTSLPNTGMFLEDD